MEVHQLVCNIQWRVGVINSIPIAVYTFYSRCTFNQWQEVLRKMLEMNVTVIGQLATVTLNRGRYRLPDLGTQFQNRAHSNEGVGTPGLIVVAAVLFLFILYYFSQPPNW
jgi:hypothetical protein